MSMKRVVKLDTTEASVLRYMRHFKLEDQQWQNHEGQCVQNWGR